MLFILSGGAHTTTPVWTWEDNLEESVLYHVNSKDWTQVTGFSEVGYQEEFGVASKALTKASPKKKPDNQWEALRTEDIQL